MTPSAEETPPIAAPAAVTERLLEEGEVIILALKPSGWYVLLASWPVLLGAALVALGAYATEMFASAGLSSQTVLAFSLAAACLRIIVACGQWTASLYILTNRRVMRVRGIFKVEIADCPLNRLQKSVLAANSVERLLGVGSLLFQTADLAVCEANWLDIAKPAEVQKVVEQAISQARGPCEHQ